MFIFPTPKTKHSYTIEKDNNKTSLTFKSPNYIQKSQQQNLPIKYLLMEDSKTGPLTFQNRTYKISNSSYHFFEIKTPTRDLLQNENLIEAFGNKKSKKLRTTLKRQSEPPQHYDEQIIPEFNTTAHNLEEIYDLNLLFPPDLIEEFKEVQFDISDLHEEVQSFFSGSFKVHLLFLDCICKVLERRFINCKIFINGCENFFDTLDVSDKVLSDKSRDRLVCVAYVLILIICRFEVDFERIPKFKNDRDRVMMFLRVIGCGFSEKSGVVRLIKKPQVQSVQKRRRRH